jgi:hypothetical protein
MAEAAAEATKASSSTILTEILTSETADWREAINHFMEQKTTEFQAIMKTTIQNTMSEKLSNFYNRSFDHDNVLFDTEPGDICKQCLGSLQTQIGSNPQLRTTLQPAIKILETSNTKCFMANPVHEAGTSMRRQIYIFKTFIVIKTINSWTNGSNEHCEFHSHNMPSDTLFAMKTFQMRNDYNCIASGLKLYNDHPEYFKQNCSEFENICKREYEMIQAKKDELQRLIDENVANTDHYRSLEDQIKTLADEKQAIDNDRQKLKEERDTLVIVKHKLAKMKADIDQERQAFEEEKNKLNVSPTDIDINTYFDV